jgi:hypothetical protein
VGFVAERFKLDPFDRFSRDPIVGSISEDPTFLIQLTRKGSEGGTGGKGNQGMPKRFL